MGPRLRDLGAVPHRLRLGRGEIGKRTNGRYQIDVYPASQLGKETDINQGLSLGSVDMIISGSSFAAKSYPPIGVTYYPYTFRDADHLLAYTKSDVFKELTKGYEDKTGHRIVAVTYYGVRHTSSNKPIKTCADMKGLARFACLTCRPISRCRAPAAPTPRRSPLPRSISRCRTAPWKPRKIRSPRSRPRSSTRCRSTSC